jgi:hypothetical protein
MGSLGAMSGRPAARLGLREPRREEGRDLEQQQQQQQGSKVVSDVRGGNARKG